ILWIGHEYKQFQIQAVEHQKYQNLSQNVQAQITTLISEKQSATNTLAITLTQDKDIRRAFSEPSDYLKYLEQLTQRLKVDTDYKNVWIQLISNQGISLGRTWTPNIGDDLSKIRVDVKQMLTNPKPQSTISIGKFDLSFKSMVPIYNAQKQFIGIIEVITHFNSIAEKLKVADGLPIIVVNKRFKSQIKTPFTRIFAGEHYIANKNANPQLVELITQKGVSDFISENQPYVVDRENQYLVIHQGLFDRNDSLLADIFVFKPLNKIDLSAINKMKNNVNLLKIIMILILWFSVYFLKRRKIINALEKTNESKFKIIFLAIYSVVIVVYISFIAWSYQTNQTNFIKTHNAEIQRDFNIFYEKLNTLSSVVLQSIVKRPSVIQQMTKAYGSPQQKEQARQTLYTLLKDEYKNLKIFDIKQLHFHLKNNESFLRFHRPEKYGDNLTGIRESVEWVNIHHQPFQGFEEGRIFNGFRYVFPLTHTSENGLINHLGSVEVSFNAHAIAKQFATFRNAKTGFVIKRALVEKMVFTSELGNYIPSDIPNFFAEKQIVNSLIAEGNAAKLQNFTQSKLMAISNSLLAGDIFSVQTQQTNLNQSTLFSFIPLKDTFNGSVSAGIIVQQNSHELAIQKLLHLILLLVGVTIISFLFIFIYKETLNTNRYKHLSKTTQHILDSQESIILVSNGYHPEYVNQAFLKFFNYPNLASFMKQHSSISELFVPDNRFFHINKIAKPEQHNWPKYLLELPSKERMVCILDKQNQATIFSLMIKPFDNSYILNFADITDTMTEHYQLESKAIHDPLTQAFNRQYF
ncbi:MAG: cache domain-containing protein, partial [Thiomicrorhabdus sp.]|nr:cache domain-containing protein [Thiomicrorhabdus sp.]